MTDVVWNPALFNCTDLSTSCATGWLELDPPDDLDTLRLEVPDTSLRDPLAGTSTTGMNDYLAYHQSDQ